MDFGQASDDIHNPTDTMHVVPESVLLQEKHIIKQELLFEPELKPAQPRKRKLPGNKSKTDKRNRIKIKDSKTIPEEVFDQKIDEAVLEEEMDVKSEDESDMDEEIYDRDEIWDEFTDSKKFCSKGSKTREEVLLRRIRLLQQRGRRREQKLQKLKAPKEEKIKKLVRDYIVKHHSFSWAIFIVDKKSPNSVWTEQEVLKAIGLRRIISKKAYNYIRDNAICPLPSISTIYKKAKGHPEWEVLVIGEEASPTVTKRTERPGANDKENANATSSGGNANPCGQCGKSFGYKAPLNEHLAEVHGDERARKMQCKVCNKWMSTSEKMKGHNNMHMGTKPYKCDFCEKCYRTRPNMAAHRKEMHGEEWKVELSKRISEGRKSSNPCPHCGLQFPIQTALNQHLAEIHDDSEAKELQCQTCDKFFRSKEVLKNHARIHTGDRPYKCDFCPKSFLSHNTMDVHRKHMHPDEWEANKDQIFAQNKEAMKMKMRAAWAGRKETMPKKEDTNSEKIDGRASSNPCPQCGMDFPFQGKLYQHLADVHEDAEAIKFQCKTCEKWLGSKLLLENHMRTHTGERPYKCDFCPRLFASQKYMGRHRVEDHSEEWEANKTRIMARNKALTKAKRYNKTNEETCGEDNGEATILDEETGVVYN